MAQWAKEELTVLFKLMRISKLEKEIKKLQEENARLKEAQKRCTECENFDKRRKLIEDPE